MIDLIILILKCLPVVFALWFIGTVIEVIERAPWMWRCYQEGKNPFKSGLNPDGTTDHGGKVLVVRSKATPSEIKLQMWLKPSFSGAGCRLEKWRKRSDQSEYEGPHEFYENSVIIDQVAEGVTYDYSISVEKKFAFTMPGPVAFESALLVDRVRFSVKVPASSNRSKTLEQDIAVKRLEQQLAAFAPPVAQPPDEAELKLKKLRDEAVGFFRANEDLDSIEAEMMQKILAGSYSETERKDRLERLKETMAMLRDKI